MQHPASSQHSLNNFQKENLQIGNLTKSNSNQITLFSKFVNLKLLTGSLLLLLLAACGGETGGNGVKGGNGGETGGNGGETGGSGGETGGKGDEKPSVDRCKADNTIEGCPGYVAPIRNSYLTQEKLTAKADGESKPGVPNYLIGPNYDTLGSTQPDAGAGHNINEVFYGTIDKLGTTYKSSDTFATDFPFIEATTEADKKDDDKNNIIKISTHITSEVATDNYYYSHIGGKQFTQFLPAINKLEILALNADLATEDNLDNILFPNNVEATIYNKLKDFVVKAKNYTFKGFTLVGFFNKVTELNAYSINETDLYPGSFKLTFNSVGVEQANIDKTDDDYFSMKITLDQEAAEVPTPTANGVLPQVAAKPAVKTIEIKNFNFLKSEAASEKLRSYPEQTDWSYFISLNSYLAFSENAAKAKIDQIAGSFYLLRHVDANSTNNIPKHTQYIKIAFASNEVCDSGTSTTGTDDCPKVKLTE